MQSWGWTGNGVSWVYRQKSVVGSPRKLKDKSSQCDNEKSALTLSPEGLKHAGELRESGRKSISKEGKLLVWMLSLSLLRLLNNDRATKYA